jgi:hypothetical protein
MKEIRLTFSAVAFSVIVMLLAVGCGLDTKENNNGTPNGGEAGGETSDPAGKFGDSIEVARVTAKDLIAPEEDSLVARSIARGANEFAFRFAATLAKEAGNENLVCSP